MKERETCKKSYIRNFRESYLSEMAGIMSYKDSEMSYIELKASFHFDKRKKDISDKCDALLFSTLDAKEESDRLKALLF